MSRRGWGKKGSILDIVGSEKATLRPDHCWTLQKRKPATMKGPMTQPLPPRAGEGPWRVGGGEGQERPVPNHFGPCVGPLVAGVVGPTIQMPGEGAECEESSGFGPLCVHCQGRGHFHNPITNGSGKHKHFKPNPKCNSSVTNQRHGRHQPSKPSPERNDIWGGKKNHLPFLKMTGENECI